MPVATKSPGCPPRRLFLCSGVARRRGTSTANAASQMAPKIAVSDRFAVGGQSKGCLHLFFSNRTMPDTVGTLWRRQRKPSALIGLKKDRHNGLKGSLQVFLRDESGLVKA